MGEYSYETKPAKECQIVLTPSIGQQMPNYYNQTFVMKKERQIENHHISSFILKLSRLLEDPLSKRTVTWSHQGNSITIDSHNEMLEVILSQYFNHTKISSFVRQLNLYGFRKISEKGSEMMYKHPYFIRDKINLHKMIKRKRKIRTKLQQIGTTETKPQNSMLEKQKAKIKGLEDIYFRIKKENQKITSQSVDVKNNTYVLDSIKGSSFLDVLRASMNENCMKYDCMSSEKNTSKSDDQPLTPEIQTIQMTNREKQQQQQDRKFCFSSLKNMPNRQNSQQNSQSQQSQQSQSQKTEQANNEMEIFEQSYEELSRDQMNDDGEANFWQDNKGNGEYSEFKE